MSIRPFELVRHKDVSGVTGTGVIAEGSQFTDGSVALRWLQYPSTAVWPSLDSLLAVHGHSGATVVRYLDEHEQHCGNSAPGIRHEVAVAELDGEGGYTVCLWPCGHEAPNSPTQCDCVPLDTSGAPY